MRAWTLGVSIAFHLSVITGVVVAPLFATGDLPEPRRAAPEYVLVTAKLPPDPAPVPRNRAAPVSTSTAPLTPPDSVRPETPVTPPALGPVDFDSPVGDAAFTGVGPANMVDGGDPLPLPPTPPPAPKPPVPVGGVIRAPQKIKDVAPRYPALAQSAGVEGVVILQAVIGEDGSVLAVSVLKGKPLLDQAASDAVRQWRFTPTLLNGHPVPVVMTVTVAFTLNR
jgi:protein TonB